LRGRFFAKAAMKLVTPFLALLLIPLLVVSPIGAQVPETTAAALQLRLLQSDPAVTVNSRSAQGFLVEATDANGAPVPEAAIALRLPESGPSGTFADGSHSAVVYTDAAGRAHLTGILWGGIAGTAELRLTVAKGSAHAGLLLEQTLNAASSSASVPAPAIQAALEKTPGPVVAIAAPKPVQPGTLPAPAPAVLPPSVIIATAHSGASSPVLPAAAKPDNADKQPPSVSVTSASPGAYPSHSSKKWVIIALIAVGAGAGAAFAFKGKGSTPAAAPGLSIGAPSISVGH
jgi:hypothetical protein